LTNVTIMPGFREENRETLSFIPHHMFEGCSNLRNISIPENIYTIQNGAFYECKSLEEIELPVRLNQIGMECFYGCGFKTVTIPASLNILGANPFGNCHNLEEILVGPHTGQGKVFYASDHGALIDVEWGMVQLPQAWSGVYTLLDSIVKIDKYMFRGCHKLKGLIIPPSIKSIVDDAFLGCSSLQFIEVNDSNVYYKSVDGVLYDRKTDILLRYPEGKIGSYAIPDGVTGINHNAFLDCSSLTDVIIPSSVNKIENNAFTNCINLQKVTITDGVTSIGDYAFTNCTSLESLIIPSSVTSIGLSTFSGCSQLRSIKYTGISNPCADIESYDALEGCDSMQYICVPVGYSDSKFCNSNYFCRTDSCEELHFDGNHCYEEVCKDGKKVLEKRENATQWELKRTGCVECQCNNDVGKVQWSMCNSTSEHIFMCTNDGCLVRNQEYLVLIAFGNIQATDMDMAEILLQIKALTNMNVLKVGIELGDQAYVLRVVLVVDDKETGTVIVQAVENMDRGKSCEYGTLCRSKSAELLINEKNSQEENHPFAFSSAQTIHIKAKMIFIVFILNMIIIMFIKNL